MTLSLLWGRLKTSQMRDVIDAMHLTAAAGEAGCLVDAWPSEQKGRGRERGRRGEGGVLYPHLFCSFSTRGRRGPGGDTQGNKLIP